MKILGTIITYNPEIERFKENYLSLYSQVDSVLIVDNYSNNFTEIQTFIESSAVLNTNIIRNFSNKGLASALNQAFEYATNNHFEWNITMDQDSILQSNFISVCKQILIKRAGQKIGIIAPSVIDVNNKKKVVSKVNNEDDTEVVCVITSGSLTNVNGFKSVGSFNEELFIDQLDYDLCLNLYSSNYKIIQTSQSYMNHQLGKVSTHKIFNTQFLSTNHSSTRLFYIYRNYLYIRHKYKNLRKRDKYVKEWFHIQSSRLILRPIKILLVEKNKIKKIESIIKGIWKSKEIRKRGGNSENIYTQD